MSPPTRAYAGPGRRTAVARRSAEGESRDYAGARNSKFVLAPGSVRYQGRRAGWWWPAGGDRPAVRDDRGPIEPGGARTRCGTSGSAHHQRARTGRQARRGDGLRAVTLYGLPLVPRRVGWARRSIRRWPASCSSTTPWSTATGRPATTSSATMQTRKPELAELEERRGAATCWSPTTRSMRSTPPASPSRWSGPAFSTAGGRSNAIAHRTR